MENAAVKQDQTEYDKHYNALVALYDEKRARYDKLPEEIGNLEKSAERINALETAIRSMKGAVTELDEDLWSGMVETVTVQRDGSMVFRFIGAGKVRIKKWRER